MRDLFGRHRAKESKSLALTIALLVTGGEAELVLAVRAKGRRNFVLHFSDHSVLAQRHAEVRLFAQVQVHVGGKNLARARAHGVALLRRGVRGALSPLLLARLGLLDLPSLFLGGRRGVRFVVVVEVRLRDVQVAGDVARS